MILGVILFSSSVGALSVVILRRSFFYFSVEGTSIILPIVFGFSTSIFSYSIVLIGNSFFYSLLLLSFYFLKKDSKYNYILSGILLDLAMLLDYISLIIATILIIFSLWNIANVKEKVKLSFSFLFGIFPLLIYSFLNLQQSTWI